MATSNGRGFATTPGEVRPPTGGLRPCLSPCWGDLIKATAGGSRPGQVAGRSISWAPRVIPAGAGPSPRQTAWPPQGLRFPGLGRRSPVVRVTTEQTRGRPADCPQAPPPRHGKPLVTRRPSAPAARVLRPLRLHDHHTPTPHAFKDDRAPPPPPRRPWGGLKPAKNNSVVTGVGPANGPRPESASHAGAAGRPRALDAA